MRAFDFPFLWIEVVGAVTNVFLEAKRLLPVADEHKSAGRVSGQGHRLLTQEADGIGIGQVHLRECRPLQGCAQSQRRVRDEIATLHHSQSHSGVDDVQQLPHTTV